MGVRAIVFDCDGVLADTERYGHLPAFNAVFREFGVPLEWSEAEYGERLRVAGGKERMASALTPDVIRAAGLPDDPEALAGHVAAWHKRKTALYTEMVTAGRLPPRPGVTRLIAEAQDAGWRLGVASTSAEPSVRAILDQAAGPERAARFDVVLAGDCVAHKKPAPDIYLLALERLGMEPGGRARRGGLAHRAGGGGRRRSPLPRDRERLHRGGGLLRGVAGRIVAG